MASVHQPHMTHSIIRELIDSSRLPASAGHWGSCPVCSMLPLLLSGNRTSVDGCVRTSSCTFHTICNHGCCTQYRSNWTSNLTSKLTAVIGLLFLVSALNDGRGQRIGAFLPLLCSTAAWLNRCRLYRHCSPCLQTSSIQLLMPGKVVQWTSSAHLQDGNIASLTIVPNHLLPCKNCQNRMQPRFWVTSPTKATFLGRMTG